MNISNTTLQQLRENGFPTLYCYYQSLARVNGTTLEVVENVAEFLGEKELFTGLGVLLEETVREGCIGAKRNIYIDSSS